MSGTAEGEKASVEGVKVDVQTPALEEPSVDAKKPKKGFFGRILKKNPGVKVSHAPLSVCLSYLTRGTWPGTVFASGLSIVRVPLRDRFLFDCRIKPELRE